MLSKLKPISISKHFSPRATRVYIHNIPSITSSPRFFCNPACQFITSDAIEEAPSKSPYPPPWAKFREDEHQFLTDSDEDPLFPVISATLQNSELPDLARAITTIPIDPTVRDAATICKTLKKGFSGPEAAAEALMESGVAPSEILVEHLLKRLRYDWVLALGVFNWAKSQMGYQHSSNAYAMIIDVLGKWKQFDTMLEMAKEMENVQRTSPFEASSNMISVLANADRWSDSIASFREAWQNGIAMDIKLLNILMSCLVRRTKGVAYAEDVFLEFKDRIPPDASTYNTLIKGWCKLRKLDVAPKTDPKVDSDSDSYVSRTLAESRAKALNFDRILEEMHRNGCAPNPVTYTHVIRFLCDDNIAEALNVFEKMKQRGCDPDAICYGTVVTGLLFAGRLAEARALFQDMKTKGFHPEASTYAAFITHFCKQSKEKDAAEVLKESYQPNHSAYVSLLILCCRKKRMKTLYYLLGHMLKNNVGMEMKVYLTLVRELCSNGKLEHACLFVEHGVARGWFLPASACRRLIDKLREKKKERAVEMIQKLMLQPGSDSLFEIYKLLKKSAGKLQVGTGLIVKV